MVKGDEVKSQSDRSKLNLAEMAVSVALRISLIGPYRLGSLLTLGIPV